ncbi:MAG: bifunctional folylpolyglutamate synthase/dihydrofolate synthase [Gammaproteobacteria bacterium]|nr:bifunctional folylpolyglutamate synthase/dihydrofolate synthase [Gammaproteobacteria bacterium]
MSQLSTPKLNAPSQEGSLDQWLEYWQSIHATAIDMGLERVRPVAEYLAILHPQVPVITVAGTNGKGSTTTVIAAIYQAAGLRVGLYQSPHIQYFNERIRLGGVPVENQILINAFVEVEAARVACGLTLSFFEATTLAAFVIFKQQKCDVWVLEVGLGGRLDVVNLIDPTVAVITNIGIDHVEWLGDNREAIGFEKAGILRQNIPLIFGDVDMPHSVRQRAEVLNCRVYQSGRDYFWQNFDADAREVGKNVDQKNSLLHVAHSENSQSAIYTMDAHTLILPKAYLALTNISCAVSAVLVSPIPVQITEIIKGIWSAKLAGRFEERQYHGKRLIADVAHNPHGVHFLLEQLFAYRKKHVTRQIHAIFSMLADKDIDSVVDMVKGSVFHWHIAALEVPRAASLEQLQVALKNEALSGKVTVYQSIGDALVGASRVAQNDDVMLAWGSFYTLEAIYQQIQMEDKPF